MAILLSGCTSIATNVALINVLASERSLEPEKPKKIKRNSGGVYPGNTVGSARTSAGGSTPQGTPPDAFHNRFGQWKKTKLELWGPA